MLELVTVVWVFVLVFAAVGLGRGWTKEIIAMAGIMLGLFALHQFDAAIREQLLVNFSPQGKFLFQSAVLMIIAFFAYQTRALVSRRAPDAPNEAGRDALQAKALGGIVGALNGYLLSGTIWYFMHINEYPLAPYIEAPAAGSLSMNTVSNLPLYLLAEGPGSSGDLLSLSLIGLFIVVLVLI
ncbi:MAG: CvpA family protein [Chloroflexi bacterium]|nr:CvpA family protein [Chloroflexota bacterium]